MPLDHLQEHIDVIAKHEQEFLSSRTSAERLGDALAGFAGSFWFVSIHIAIFVLWIVFNTLPQSPIHHFDPSPFPLLGTVVALEAILLASIILMRQARMSRRSDERDHLMLQILLLTEKEITAVLTMDRRIADQVGLEPMQNEKELEQLSQQTSIDEVAQTIKENLPT
jgi:uncharacterized membrane protein